MFKIYNLLLLEAHLGRKHFAIAFVATYALSVGLVVFLTQVATDNLLQAHLTYVKTADNTPLLKAEEFVLQLKTFSFLLNLMFLVTTSALVAFRVRDIFKPKYFAIASIIVFAPFAVLLEGLASLAFFLTTSFLLTIAPPRR